MENTVHRLAQILGASGVEVAGHDARFAVKDASGAVLKVSIEGDEQRFMCVLKDSAGETRCSIDVGRVTHVREEKGFDGRVRLELGKLMLVIDSKPTLAVEIVTI